MLGPFRIDIREYLADMPAATAPGFVHLHVHSSYSLLEGALTIARLVELAKKDRQPALALTDTDNMFGALEFSEKMAGAGIQPSSAARSASISATRTIAARRSARTGRGSCSLPPARMAIAA